MIVRFDGEEFVSDVDGDRLLAEQAVKAKNSIQVASLDGSHPEPCLLVVCKNKTVRLAGADIDQFISVCNQDGEFVVGYAQEDEGQ